MTWKTLPRSKASNGLAFHRRGAGGDVGLVLLHGVGLRAEAWNAQLEALGERFEITAVDLPGHGASNTNANANSIKDYAKLIGDALPPSDLPRVVIGHSMGAMVALEMAALMPDRVVGVIALNAVFERGPDASDAVRQRADVVVNTGMIDTDAPIIRWFPGATESDEAVACRDWLASMEPAVYAKAYGLFANNDSPSREQLQSLHCPALFMTGGRDPNSTPAMSVNMAKLTRDGKACVVEDAAHMMPMTHAGEVTRQIEDFVQRLAGEMS